MTKDEIRAAWQAKCDQRAYDMGYAGWFAFDAGDCNWVEVKARATSGHTESEQAAFWTGFRKAQDIRIGR